MRVLAVLLFVVPALAGNMQPVTILGEPPAVQVSQPASVDLSGRVGFRPLVGTIDTVGGTTYDWQTGMPAYRWMVHSPGWGVQITWMYSTEMVGTSFTDRNQRYVFYDLATRTWPYDSADFLYSGTNAYPYRTGWGNVDYEPATGAVVIGTHSTHGGLTIHPDLAREVAPGSGIFEFAEGDPVVTGYQWPVIATDSSGTVQVMPITASYLLAYTRTDPWPQFTAPVNSFPPDPGFPSHNIGASKVSEKVCLIWEDSNTDLFCYFSVSQDGGQTWPTPTPLAPPVAYGGDTVTTFHISSPFPFFDHADQLHIVAGVGPTVHDTGYVIPAEIWHWKDGDWTEIHRAGCDPANLQAQVGYNALYACRASIGEDSRGDLYVTWEQFDSANVEPITSFLRADIFAAASEDGGQSWLPAVKLTDAGTSSLRFASVIDRMVPGEPETLLVRYMSDPVAGFYVQSQGPATICPIIVQKLPVSDLGVGIAEAGESGPWRPELRVSPTLFHDGTTIRVSLPRAEQAAVRIFDALGREVRQFPAGPSRVSSLTWNGCDETGRRLSPGVYVVRLVGAGREVSRKVVLTGPRQ